MKKYLLLFIVFFTGCSVESNLVITDQKIVYEDIKVNIFNEIDVSDYFSSVHEFLDVNTAVYSDLDGYNHLKILYKEGKVESSINATGQYSDLLEFSKSYTIMNLFTTTTTTKAGEYTIFRTDDLFRWSFNEADESSDVYVDYIDINIKFYNYVVDHNADSCNEKEGICTWRFTKDDIGKNVYFKINNDVNYYVKYKDIIMKNLLPISIVSVSLIGLSIFAFHIGLSIKKNDEI